MMERIAENRMARSAALELGKKGVYIPLAKLKRLLQKALSGAGNASAMPPEVAAVEQQTDFRTIAWETALQLFQMKLESLPSGMKSLDSHKWTDDVRRIYRDVLKELER
ncbi:hypothetical protein HQ520_05675 [bacterium]|nr:hypothetical protein [bacterium]